MSNKLVTIFARHLDSFTQKQNFSSVYQICDSGSGQILQPGQLNRSPGLAKIAPWCLAHRENFSAKAVGEETGWASPPTLTSHTRWPLYVMLRTGLKAKRTRPQRRINITNDLQNKN
jgi:hypothetical protein